MALSISSRSSVAVEVAEPLETPKPPPPPALPPPPPPVVQSRFEDASTATPRAGSTFEAAPKVAICMGPSPQPSTQPITCMGPPDATKTTAPAVTSADTKEWPGGTPGAREKTRIEEAGLTVPPSEKLATVLEVLPSSARGPVKALVEKQPGVTPESLDAAYQQVLTARQTPGQKQLELSLTPLEERRTSGDAESTSLIPLEPRTFKASLDVGADGSVNGKPLAVDELARLGTQLTTVPREVKDQVLREAGLSQNWINHADDGQRDFALAKLRQLSATPGSHDLDLPCTYTEERESGTLTVTEPGRLTLTAAADGTVNGKPPLVETALATQLTMEKLSMAEKRELLAQVGFPPEATASVRPDEAASILSRVSFATREPGEHSMYVKVDGASWMLGVAVGEAGQITGAGAQKLPPDPPFWKQVIGPVLSVVSIAFPVVAPFAMALNGAMALSSGAKGLGLVAAVASVAGGVGGMVGTLSSSAQVMSTANMLSDVAGALNGANGLINGVKNRDLGAFFSSAMSVASSVGNLTGTSVSTMSGLAPSTLSMLTTAGKALSVVDSLVSGDLAGAFTGAVGLGQAEVARQEAELASYSATESTRFANRAATGAEERADASFNETELQRFVNRANTAREAATQPSVEHAPGQVDVRRIDNEQLTEFGTRPTVKVVSGDNLTRIATSQLGDASRTPELYAWNAGTIGASPNSLRVGVELELPPEDFRLSDAERAQFFAVTHVAPPVTTPVTTTQGSTPEVTGTPTTTSTTGATATTAATPASTPSTPSLWDRVSDAINNFNPRNYKGLNFFGLGDPAASAIDHPATKDPGVFVITGHGNQQIVSDQSFLTTAIGAARDTLGLKTQDTGITVADMAERITSSANWQNKPIVLLACNTGTGGNSFAQQLANRLGVPVAAGDGYVGSNADGSFVSTTLKMVDGHQQLGDANLRGLTWFTPRGH